MNSDKKLLRKIGKKIQRIATADAGAIQDETTRVLLVETLGHFCDMIMSAAAEPTEVLPKQEGELNDN